MAEVKFIGQSVKYVGGYGGAQTVESAAKTCTQTKQSEEPDKFVSKLIKRGHMSPVEFGFADFLIECDRAIQQELTRHRHFSFNIESTRWISYLKKPLRFVTKPPEGWDVPEDAIKLLEDFCELSALVYEALLEMGAPRDYARKAFVLALASKMRMAGNFRTWLEMLIKRLGKTAHPEAKEIARLVTFELRDRVLGVFDSLESRE